MAARVSRNFPVSTTNNGRRKKSSIELRVNVAEDSRFHHRWSHFGWSRHRSFLLCGRFESQIHDQNDERCQNLSRRDENMQISGSLRANNKIPLRPSWEASKCSIRWAISHVRPAQFLSVLLVLFLPFLFQFMNEIASQLWKECVGWNRLWMENRCRVFIWMRVKHLK